MTSPYRDHCSNWHGTDLFSVNGESGSLHLFDVKFCECRAQYRTLIHMNNSSNLIMVNTKFEKVQTYGGTDSDGKSWGVIAIVYETSCPSIGCEPIVFRD